LEERLNDLQGKLMRGGIVRKGLERAVRSLQREVASLKQDVDNLSRRLEESAASAPVDLPTSTDAGLPLHLQILAEVTNLASILPNGRRFSPAMMDFPFTLNAISARASRHLRAVLPFPSCSASF
jgi:hypothetical protein